MMDCVFKYHYYTRNPGINSPLPVSLLFGGEKQPAIHSYWSPPLALNEPSDTISTREVLFLRMTIPQCGMIWLSDLSSVSPHFYCDISRLNSFPVIYSILSFYVSIITSHFHFIFIYLSLLTNTIQAWPSKKA
ncbi:hypothetical protein BDV26DRAFT_260016 [Aspergillus bertholletiae]|uniref:Uncharacterized protein n=1 Tax=Aspergillus bertholletiae TaxID=1226010 RepID=A0A5N7BC31_9EURO|nr:hypothetical protein BDV26DRAFT_260016 [Aspergillus bertholletiae]